MVGRKKPLLPAPTDSLVNDDAEEPAGSTTTYIPDNDTDLSQRTDHTSYSIPEDGRPLTLPTKKIRADRTRGATGLSETSLLIEYYEGDKSSRNGPQSRPSVRVKVSPRARRLSQETRDVKPTQVGSARKPSHTHRIPLGAQRMLDASEVSETNQRDESDLSLHSPADVDTMDKSQVDSDVGTRKVVLPSDVSSMPPDSMVDGPPVIIAPAKEPSQSPANEAAAQPRKKMIKATLKAPNVERTRSKSTERITQKAIEKLQREQEEEPSPPKTTSKARPKSGGSDSVAASDRVRSKRSSRSQRDSDLRSGTESSLVPNRELESNVSSGSKISINNPKLLATVEDAIRRLILPEIETIKRNQSVRSTRTRESFISEDSMSRSGINHRLSKSTSEPQVKGKSVQDDKYGDYALGNSSRRRKHRHSSRDSTSSRQDSVDSIAREKERARRHRHRDSNDTSLTRENLRSHDSGSSVQSDVEHSGHRRRDRDRRRSDSIANTDDEYYDQKSSIPPMPMASEIQDSELTRDSLLSEDTVGSVGEEHAKAIPQTARQVPIVREVNRASPHTVESPISRPTVKSPVAKENSSPRSVRSRDEKSIRSSKSDRSIGSNKKSAAYAVSGLSAAAAGLYGHEPKLDDRSSAKHEKRSASGDRTREASSGHIEREVSSKSKPTYKRSPLSKESLKSGPSVEYPLTQKRHQGINLENDDPVLEDECDPDGPYDGKDDEDEKFYERQREVNDEYRSSVDYDGQRESMGTNEWKDQVPEESPLNASDPFTSATTGQQLRGVGANAQVVHTPMLAESAIASLAGDSVTSFHSDDYTQSRQSKFQPVDTTPELQVQPGQDSPERRQMNLHNTASAERWNAIRGHAQALSQGAVTLSDSGSIREPRYANSDDLHMSATGGPIEHPMPEAEYIYDNQSVTDHGGMEHKPPSVIEGRLGDEYENQGLWPYEPTPDIETRRGGMVLPDANDGSYRPDQSGAVIGAAGAGLGIGTATAAALGAGRIDQDSYRPLPQRGLGIDDQYLHDPSPGPQGYADRQAADSRDEGYVTGDPGRSVGGETPLSFSKPPPKLFDDATAKYDSMDLDDNPYSTPSNPKHLSANSHGLSTGSYDAAFGTGIDHIQSKDVVALMDHLTVRDGHRNARDTEILVTLVRSAAEMRDSFDEMKKFIELQNQSSTKRTEQNTQSAINKIMNEARSLPTSTRNLRSVSGVSDNEEAPAKKQNIFKRALKGLGSRNEKDLGKMENMLMQLLEEVEALRTAQNNSLPPPSMVQSRGLDSYERLRAAPESGYEPEGHAGTSSTTGVSVTPNSQSRGPRMHSGYTYNRDSGTRISTVLEGDEDTAANGYEHEDGMLTPTQENQRGLGPNYNTPPSAGKQFQGSQFTPNTPKTGERRSRQQSTSSSMFGGIPKISRWSKTTTSSAGEGRQSFQKDRPYSEASRSGSDINVLPGEHEPYVPNDSDRLRSADSLAEARKYDDHTPSRAESPVLPDDASAEDPKYRANRHSLTLEHPQPRQGSAHRHPPHLESQAQTYRHANTSRTSQNSQASSTSPHNDVFGSVPGLAKNRFSTGDGPSRRSSTRDEGPLIPSKDHYSQGESKQRSNVQQYEDDGDSYDSLEDAHYRRSAGRHGHDGSYDSPEAGRYDDDYDSLDSDPEVEYEDDEGSYYPPPIPLERPRSPYSPGGLLEPIEERYSLEQSRISSPMSRRDTLNSKKTSRIEEEDEEGEQRTPELSPRPAVGGQVSPEGRRKITGPREMPHSRSASGGIMRKPVAGS